MSSESRSDDAAIGGNLYNKYESRNPIVRRLVAGFERSLRSLLAPIGPVRTVLEVGCGEGYVTAMLASALPEARLLATDVSPEIVEIARRQQPGIEFEVCSIYDVAALGTWDLVVACEVFEHLDDPQRALDAMAAAARGHVLVSVPREPLWRILNVARGSYWQALGNTHGHLQHWGRRSLSAFLATRFDVVATRTPLPWTQVLARSRPGGPA